MKFGVTSFVWPTPFSDDPGAVARRAAAAGYDVLEFPVAPGSTLDPAAVAESLAASGLEAAILAPARAGTDLTSADPEVRAAGRAHLRFVVDVAATTGASVVAGPFHRAVGLREPAGSDERRAQRERAAACLREVGTYAAERGVTLALEPLNRFETDLLNTLEQGVALCELVDLPNVGLLADVFHMNIEERGVGAALRAAGPYVRHFHACDTDRGVPGSAHADWQEIADALRDIAFDGIVSFESWSGERLSGPGQWRPWFGDADAAAREALRFLRACLDPRDLRAAS